MRDIIGRDSDETNDHNDDDHRHDHNGGDDDGQNDHNDDGDHNEGMFLQFRKLHLGPHAH